MILDTPSGLIRARVRVRNGCAQEVTIENVLSFLYLENQQIELANGRTVSFDISFGGSFFALVDADRLGLSLTTDHVDELIRLGMDLLSRINRTVTVRHPCLDINSVDLVEFYSKTASAGADMRNCIVFGDAQVDRSPCGTGTSAKLAALYARGEPGLREPFVYESITGSHFQDEVLRETAIGSHRGIVPEITGRAYLTGASQRLLRADDPLRYGFLLG